MGNFISHYMAQNNRVNAITVTKDGIIVKHPTARPRHSFVRSLLSPCCGQRSAVDVHYGGMQAPGVARFKRRRVFQRKAAGLVAPVYNEDLTWAIPRSNFKAFIDRDIFITSRSRGCVDKDDASSVLTDDSSEVLSRSSSTHSATDDPVANANLQTLLRFRKKCSLSDPQVEFEDDDIVFPLGFIEATENVKEEGSITSANVRSDDRCWEISKDKALQPKPSKSLGLKEPQTIIPVHPLPLVDVKAGDIPVTERSPILLNKKGGGGPKGILSPGVALPCVSADPLSSSAIPPPAKCAERNASAMQLVVGSIPVVAKSKTLGNKLLPLRAMLSMDVTLPSEVQVSAPKPAKLKGILKISSENKNEAVSSFPGAPPAVCKSNKHTVIHSFPMAASDSEEEIEYFDVDGSKISKPRITSSGNYCPSQVALMAKKSELPSPKKMYGSSAEKASKASTGRKKKKPAKQKKRKAKRRDSLVHAPVVNSVDRRHRDTGVLADHQKIYDEGELTLGVPASNVVDQVSQFGLPASNVVDHVRQAENHRANITNNNDEDSEEEIEYFYPDGIKIPKGGEALCVIGKPVQLVDVVPPNSCSSQAQMIAWESEVKTSSHRGKWK